MSCICFLPVPGLALNCSTVPRCIHSAWMGGSHFELPSTPGIRQPSAGSLPVYACCGGTSISYIPCLVGALVCFRSWTFHLGLHSAPRPVKTLRHLLSVRCTGPYIVAVKGRTQLGGRKKKFFTGPLEVRIKTLPSPHLSSLLSILAPPLSHRQTFQKAFFKTLAKTLFSNNTFLTQKHGCYYYCNLCCHCCR